MRPIDQLGMGPTYKCETIAGNKIRVTVTPPQWTNTGNGASLDLTEDQFVRFLSWRNEGILIQNALPELQAHEREILMTGIGPEKWDEMFKGDEDGGKTT